MQTENKHERTVLLNDEQVVDFDKMVEEALNKEKMKELWSSIPPDLKDPILKNY